MPTIKDIAEAVGVSIGTVDRIIHKRGRYSEKTAEKVRRAMVEMNYTPNIHARGLKKTRHFNFSAVIPHAGQDSGYWELVIRGISHAAAELSSFGSHIEVLTFDRYSPQSCSDVMEKACRLGPDGLLIAPVRPEEVKNCLYDKSIPYLFIDSDIPELTEKISYIGQDSYQSGILSGKLMSLLLAGRENTAVMLIEPPGSNPHLKKRIKGFCDYMAENRPDCRLLDVKEEVDDEASFHRYLDAFEKESEILPQGIFVANSTVYYAASWLDKKGPSFKKVPLIGYDLIPGREEYIENGLIDFILTQQPEDQGYRGVLQLYDRLVLNKEVQKEMIVPLNIITKENLHTFENYKKTSDKKGG
ncbi:MULTISPECIES: LacI family DNA-binding transcriptional regulator [unclassified Oceanispirochaeta]|uniref:LacI family DNA-binding transcriptional regulator n=1 Tax=unclassified Oceanispirochaeta TaxID=2635722 RepID=UPI000E09CE21|nr:MULTISPECIES: LacI family DNA-binding transcriptional regulator [unclassified Oceanispirochaeta]MBF9018224.1 LacI family DNA-binding transcriptional regulator [Oceanispirochaeta sp. M2]NPD74670.1 LacI family transcriptional regulator [Oceanispirochaeta sp. M1]RDG29464.1 LacI family transcriptional regulator [Oceanispirochaeta sp. M1]